MHTAPPAGSPSRRRAPARAKKPKGLLIALIIIALLLAAGFVWALTSFMDSDTSASPEPIVEEAVVAAPVEATTQPPPPAPELAEADPVEEAAGLEPVELGSDVVKLTPGETSELTTFTVGPAGSIMEQEVGTL